MNNYTVAIVCVISGCVMVRSNPGEAWGLLVLAGIFIALF